MNGYEAQPPPWKDPYGQGRNGGPSDPGHGPPGVSRDGAAPGPTVAALVCATFATTLCCNVFAVPGIVTSAMAMSRSRTNPASARTLTIWSWVILGAALVLQIALIAMAMVLDAADAETASGGARTPPHT
ncbi:hypothetical protein GCM10023085_79320 [Actinomadura viridis]|uniref:Na+/proline symporter n=1 Tax=Actinomadura viridis TaxID=58110 RepID=A0A931DLI1_9ACTN|nr:hypothetical protein [Actinomadura viridis]MBG6093419.1 Na+/proline symporter [Actinomadura viridis]